MLFPESMVIAAADRAACRALLRTGSRTFFAASHFLPGHVREPATALYAFCRLADDAIDLDTGAGGTDRLATLARLNDRLTRAYAGHPLPIAADRAFAETIERFAIPRELPQALLEGLAWDAAGRRYATLADLKAYAARVAGTVGVMMAIVMGVRDQDALARACDLGAAMQLTNIARDIGEDAREGRLYLPLDWMREVGLDPDEWLRAPTFQPAVATLVARLLAEADRLYAASERGIAALPARCRPGIRAARILYAAIGTAVADQGFNSVDTRAIVPAARKLALLKGVLGGPNTALGPPAPAMAEARFLVEAVRPLDAPAPRRATIKQQALWVLDLFERVERRRGIEGGAWSGS